MDPGNAHYHLWLGRSYGEKAERSGLLTAARLAKKVRNEFETAVRLDPNDVEARVDLAEFYMEAPAIMGGGRDKAEAQAQQLAGRDPVKAGWLKGRLAEKYKDRVAAENEYRAAIQASHGAAGAWLNLASFYRRVSRLDAMEDAIAHASSAPMHQPQILIECAQMLLRSNRNLPQATELLRRYLNVESQRGSRSGIPGTLSAGHGTRAARQQISSCAGVPRIALPGAKLYARSERAGPPE